MATTSPSFSSIISPITSSAGMSPAVGTTMSKLHKTLDTDHILEMKKDIEVIKEAILAILADNMEIKNKQNAILEYYKRRETGIKNTQMTISPPLLYSSHPPEPSNE